MENQVRVGGCLSDAEMRKYDHKAGVFVNVDWSKKDYPFAQIRSAMQQKAGASTGDSHTIQEFTPISSQGAQDCVANAWCDMMEILEGNENDGKVEQLSRLFAYWISRYYTGDTDKDEGTYPRSMGTQFTNIGVVAEKWWPYQGSTDQVFKSPELDLYTMASNNRLNGFYKPDAVTPAQLLADFETSIRANHPFTGGWPVTKAFAYYRGESGTVFTPPGPSDEVLGNHAMIGTAFKYEAGRRLWLLRSSWGVQWGLGGHAWVDDDYIANGADFWVGTKMSPLV